MEKLNIEKAVEFYRDRFNQKALYKGSIGIDQECLDFIHLENQNDKFQKLAQMAKPFIGKNFIARIRVDDENIIYEIVSFDDEVLATTKTTRGLDLQGEFGFCVLTIPDVEVKIEIGVDPTNWSKPEKTTFEKEAKLFFAPYPLKKYLFM